MKSTRDRILQQLLKYPNSSINELADAVGINAISVRHHLTSLQADGLVTSQEERHGVGRPRLVYFLTDDGREKFPTRYLELTNRLIDHLKINFPEEAVSDIFRSIAEDIAGDKLRGLDALTFEEKLSRLQEFMVDEGFSMQWEKQGEDYYIHQISCPYYHVTQKHPEVCSLGRSLVSLFLTLNVDKISCMLQGNPHCSFHIPEEAHKGV